MNDTSPINALKHPAQPTEALHAWWQSRGEPFFDRYGTAIAIVLLGATFIAMLAWTWLRWADPIVNCGREFYIPQQLARGQVLYRDIPHFNGPFSQYFNALVFATFGASVRSLVLVNLAWLIALTVITWRMLVA